MSMIGAIETRYAGCRFRSRLEARWAVFFGYTGTRWEYEPQGYDLGPLGPYLPDFWLVDHEAWFEVKGRVPEPNGPEECKAAALRDLTEAPVILAAGQIGDRLHRFFAYDVGDSSAGAWQSDCVWSNPEHGGIMDLLVDAAPGREFYADPMFTRGLAWARSAPQMHLCTAWDAYREARSARFEHGER